MFSVVDICPMTISQRRDELSRSQRRGNCRQGRLTTDHPQFLFILLTARGATCATTALFPSCPCLVACLRACCLSDSSSFAVYIDHPEWETKADFGDNVKIVSSRAYGNGTLTCFLAMNVLNDIDGYLCCWQLCDRVA